MSALSQLAADMTAAAAAPLTQPPDDASSDSDVNALTHAPQPFNSSSLPARAASAQDHSDDDSHRSLHAARACPVLHHPLSLLICLTRLPHRVSL
jgi:hypothetical protein